MKKRIKIELLVYIWTSVQWTQMANKILFIIFSLNIFFFFTGYSLLKAGYLQIKDFENDPAYDGNTVIAILKESAKLGQRK